MEEQRDTGGESSGAPVWRASRSGSRGPVGSARPKEKQASWGRHEASITTVLIKSTELTATAGRTATLSDRQGSTTLQLARAHHRHPADRIGHVHLGVLQ